MVDIEIDESKLWDPAERQAYMDALPEMSLFEDHILEGDAMAEAIQALIEEGETAESLALHWKNRGNKAFADAKRNRQYFPDALKFYTDALGFALKALALPASERDTSFDMPELTSVIYSNRAAVHLELRNYASCRSDAALAIRYDPTAVKAYYRGAKASRMLRKPDDTLRYCAEGLKREPANKLLLTLQKEGKKLVQELKLEAYKNELEHKKRRLATDTYRQLCEARNVRVGRALVDDERVRQFEGKAALDTASNALVWPVLFLYDEHNTSDFVHAFGEHDAFVEHLANMFPEDGPFCAWDDAHAYIASQLVVYAAADVVLPFASVAEWHVALSGEKESDDDEVQRLRREEQHDAKTQVWLSVSPFCTLQQLLRHPQYVVPGIPVVNVFVRDSPALADFLRRIEHKVVTLEPDQL